MSENFDKRKIFSLLQVTQSIQKTLSERYTSSFWVKAEMNKLNFYPHSGHCYPDLVEKKDGKVIAQIKSTLWKDDYNRINHNFLRVLKTPLNDGISMLFCAKITFDSAHGLALRIVDIDPAFSLGELEREKQETIEKLKAQNIFAANKTLKLPLVPKRIAIISVQTSKGYADFLNVITDNVANYTFFHLLFPSLLQGEKAVDSILQQLNRIRSVSAHFDVVAIIRGGGGDVGLSCFNNFELAQQIATFPIPVLTGIGHATNETVVELVAHKNAITPTDLANYLIEKLHAFAGPIHRAEHILTDKAKRLLHEEYLKCRNITKYFRSITSNMLNIYNQEIQNNYMKLRKQATVVLEKQRFQQTAISYNIGREALYFCNQKKLGIKQVILNLKKDSFGYVKNAHIRVGELERSLNNMSPQNVLKRGYSITTFNGSAVVSHEAIKNMDMLQTIVSDGIIISEVKSTKRDNE